MINRFIGQNWRIYKVYPVVKLDHITGYDFSRHFQHSISYFFFFKQISKSLHYCKTPLPPHFFYESFFSIVLVNRNQTNSSDKILESRKHSIKHSIVQSNTIILSKIILVTNFDHFFLKFLVHSTVLFDTSSIHSKLLARYYQRDKKKCCND